MRFGAYMCFFVIIVHGLLPHEFMFCWVTVVVRDWAEYDISVTILVPHDRSCYLKIRGELCASVLLQFPELGFRSSKELGNSLVFEGMASNYLLI